MPYFVLRATRRRAALAMIGLAAFAAGCSDNPTGKTGVSGMYHLETIDGQPLPFAKVNSSSGVTSTVISESIALETNGTFTERLTMTQSPAGGSAQSYLFVFTGTYTMTGNQLELTEKSGSVNGSSIPITSIPVIGTLNGSSLTVTLTDFLGGTSAMLTASYRK
jgi:hypothetical protein